MTSALVRDLGEGEWAGLLHDLERSGAAVTPPLLDPSQCAALEALYDSDAGFRSRVVMARHGYGQGEYRYFAYPLPPVVEALRAQFYERLRPLAERWNALLGGAALYPPTHAAYLEDCRRAGQSRPTPLLLAYGPGDYNRLHQDLYGDLVFPLQAVVLLSRPGVDFTGGELVVTEHEARMQSRVQVLEMTQGSAAVFAVKLRPAPGVRGVRRAMMRHGVSLVRSGRRMTLGVILHDAL